VATSVAVYKGIGVLIYLIAIIFIGFVFFENNKIDRLFGMFGGGVLIGCGFWVIKVANSYRGYVCNSCGSSMLLDVLGDLHVTSDLGNKKNKFRNEWIAGLVVGLIVMGFVFKDSWSLPIVGGYSYEPKVVSLNGVLVTPKGEDPNGRLVQFYAVELPAPIKVNGNKSDPLNSETIYDIKVIQLTGDPAVINQIKSGKGASVNLTGTLFQSHNGHHFTSVLMSVKSVKFK
jgi:hypothetical protein